VARHRVVLDTNVVVSAHLRTDGRQALILELGLARRFQLCVSEDLLAEYEEVLLRPRFGFDLRLVRRSMKAIRDAALVVKPQKKFRITRDPSDDCHPERGRFSTDEGSLLIIARFLDCAVAARAAFLVTQNLSRAQSRDFPPRFRGVRIIPPIEFVEVLAAEIL
jgi:putative PIN family toxin of toxin-antitoxin system